MINFFKSFVADESGATAIEYGLIAALLSVAAITALTAMGESFDIFTYVSDTFKAALSAIDPA
jgi:pilus assembly protein Flp/PilA